MIDIKKELEDGFRIRCANSTKAKQFNITFVQELKAKGQKFCSRANSIGEEN